MDQEKTDSTATDNKPKRTRRQEWALIFRAIRLIHKISPGFIRGLLFLQFFQRISPFVGIYMTAFILNELGGERRVPYLVFYVGLALGLALALSLLSAALDRHMRLRWFRFYQDFGIYNNLKMMQLDYATIEDPKTHRMLDRYWELLTKMGGGMPAVARGFSALFGNLMSTLFSLGIIVEWLVFGIFSGGYGSSWLNSVPATVVIFLLVAVMIVVKIRFDMGGIREINNAVTDTLPFKRVFRYYTGDYLGDYHTGKEVRLYHEQDLVDVDMMRGYAQTRAANKRMNWSNSKRMLSGQLLEAGSNFSIYLLVAIRAIAGCFGVGDVLKYANGILQLTYGVSGMMSQVSYLIAKNDCLEAMFAYLDLPCRMETGSRPLPQMSAEKLEIEFRHVSFRYPDTNRDALHDLSIRLHPGERMALVGKNGSGKSTFIKLLCRMYDPTEGEILLNGVNIKEYDWESYQKLFAVVFQDFCLFALPLGQNIAASEHYDAKRVEECLRLCGFGDRLDGLQQGLDTCLYRDFDDKGVEISGGEAQKIALARAMYSQSPIMILDEPTAALDPVAEFEIYEMFHKILKGRSSVFISHRLSSCRFCSDIVVLDDGRLVQRGNHRELLSGANVGGIYEELWRAQAQYYEKTDISV